jgi:hypothetical protein
MLIDKFYFCIELTKKRKLFLIIEGIRNEKTRSVNNWYFVAKIILTYCEKNCSSDGEKLLKFEAEG